MKAKIVSQIVSEGVISYVHGDRQRIKRLFIEEKGKLAITIHNDQLFVIQDFIFTDDCKVIGEVNVSDDLIEKALIFIEIKKELRESFIATNFLN